MQPKGSGMPLLITDEPEPEPVPQDTAPTASGEDLADVVGNIGFFNSLSVAGSPVGGGGGAQAIVTATSKMVSPQYDSPANADFIASRAGVLNNGWKISLDTNLQPGWVPWIDGTSQIGDATHRLYGMYIYGKTQYHNYGTPGTSPPSGETYYYVKSDSKLYYKDSSGVELAVGSGIALNDAAQIAIEAMDNATTVAALKSALIAFIVAVTFTPTPPETPIDIQLPKEVESE